MPKVSAVESNPTLCDLSHFAGPLVYIRPVDVMKFSPMPFLLLSWVQWRLSEIGLEDYSFVLMSRCALHFPPKGLAFIQAYHLVWQLKIPPLFIRYVELNIMLLGSADTSTHSKVLEEPVG